MTISVPFLLRLGGRRVGACDLPHRCYPLFYLYTLVLIWYSISSGDPQVPLQRWHVVMCAALGYNLFALTDIKIDGHR